MRSPAGAVCEGAVRDDNILARVVCAQRVDRTETTETARSECDVGGSPNVNVHRRLALLAQVAGLDIHVATVARARTPSRKLKVYTLPADVLRAVDDENLFHGGGGGACFDLGERLTWARDVADGGILAVVVPLAWLAALC